MEARVRDVPQAPHGLPKGQDEAELKHAGHVENENKVNLNDDGTVEKPINREPPMNELVSSFITDIENYDRNHGPIQHRIAADHILTIDGLATFTSSSSLYEFTLAQLQNDFPQHKVTCALQCAGNRRHTMRTRIKEVQGVDWFDAAVMNVVWEGPRLKDVLVRAGLSEKDADSEASKRKHVQFASYGSKTQEDSWYGGSIPLHRAMNDEMDVILALKMNDKPLAARHGFPLRSIVPGVLGARSVKWLDRITLSDQESPCFYQKHDYKILPPDAVDTESAEPYWDKTPAMLDMPVNSCVAYPMSGSTLSLPASGVLEVQGYAVPHGSDGPVVRVQVSGDEGKSWTDAKLDDGGDLASKWSWVLWKASVRVKRGDKQKIYTKATDKGGNTQTAARSTWNLRGVAYNGYEAVYDLNVH